MANDPAFLFYPGDYLRDTQCLSEAAQVAYDRIMCEHMRNICISQAQLDFFTKRLTSDQKDELKMILRPHENGFCIPWVVDSITKRREYSESRRKNRSSKKKNNDPEQPNTSSSYVLHMDNENEIAIENGLIKKESVDFSDYEHWTSDVIKENDWQFSDKLRNMNIHVNGRLSELAMSHLALLAKYPKMQPGDQNKFRISLISHIQDKLKDKPGQQPTKKLTLEDLNS